MARKKKVAVIGTGYVGLSFAAVLSNLSYKVFAFDVDKEKIDTIKKGKSYFSEKGLDYLISDGVKKGLLIPTTSYEDYLHEADIVFSCVGTPDACDGSTNLDNVFDVGKIVANLCKDGIIFVQKSTVPVGTGRKLMKVIEDENPELNYSYISNPEFLAEGSAVYDTFKMDRVVLGGNNPEAIEYILGLYKSIHEGVQDMDLDKVSEFAHIYRAKNSQDEGFNIVKTSIESAELIKVTSNAFLSLKISFANSIALLCDQTGADINEVMDGVGLDKRIGRSFLYAGRGYGGGCFPKDVSGLISIAKEHNVDLEVMEASVNVNSQMPKEIVQKVKNKLGELKDKKIALLGLSFKPGTSDVRKSPAINLAKLLIEEKSFIQVYDPKAMEESKKEISDNVIYCTSIQKAIEGSDIVMIATEWPELTEYDYSKHIEEINDKLIIDCQNRLDKKKIREQGFEYIGVGRS